MRNERQDGRQGEGALTWKIRSTAAGLHGQPPQAQLLHVPQEGHRRLRRVALLAAVSWSSVSTACPRGCETPDNMKKVELVAPEEIAAAIEKVVGDSFGMGRAEIPASVLRQLLGFRRTTEGAQRRGRRRGGRCVPDSGSDVPRSSCKDVCSRWQGASMLLRKKDTRKAISDHQ